MSAIVTQQLSRSFGDREAVRELSVTVEEGEVFGLLGHNGAGKTTTLRLINGILSPTSGTVRVFEMDPYTDGAQVRQRTGVLTESPALDGQLTVTENLRMYATINDLDRDRASRATSVTLDRLSLTEFADERAGKLSAGLKQRVALARALLHDPDVLLLDEPTSSLDPVAARQVRDLISELSRGQRRTVVLCTHNLSEAQELCDRVAILQRGDLVAHGTPEQLAASVAPHAVVSIGLDRSPDAGILERLRRSPGVASAESRSAEIRIERNDPDATPAVVEALVREGYRIYRVDDAPVSLEEVYLRLHAEEEA